MTVTLRDDFTGSGSLVGRTPDGASGGAWEDGPTGQAAAGSSIGSGILSRSAFWEAYVGTSEDSADMYVEAHFLAPTFDFGARVTYPTGGGRGDFIGVYADFAGSWKLFAYASVDGVVTGYPIAELAVGFGVAIPDTSDFTVRIELLGDAVRVLLNGDEVGVGTQTDVPTGFGVILQSTGSGALCDYIEAGTLAEPPSPEFVPFWTSFRKTHEVPEAP